MSRGWIVQRSGEIQSLHDSEDSACAAATQIADVVCSAVDGRPLYVRREHGLVYIPPSVATGPQLAVAEDDS